MRRGEYSLVLFLLPKPTVSIDATCCVAGLDFFRPSTLWFPFESTRLIFATTVLSSELATVPVVEVVLPHSKVVPAFVLRKSPEITGLRSFFSDFWQVPRP